MNYYKNNIRNPRGNTYSSGLIVEGLNQDLDSIYFTCRDSLNDDSNILFEKSIGNGISLVDYDAHKDIREYAIRIAPSDTKNIQSGSYFYNLNVSVNGDTFTIMKGKFIIEQDCSRNEVISV